MTLKEVCQLVHEEYKDVFTEEEVLRAAKHFFRMLRHHINKGRAFHYPNFGTIIHTEQGLANKGQKMKTYLANKDRWLNKWEQKEKYQKWKTVDITIYFDFC